MCNLYIDIPLIAVSARVKGFASSYLTFCACYQYQCPSTCAHTHTHTHNAHKRTHAHTDAHNSNILQFRQP